MGLKSSMASAKSSLLSSDSRAFIQAMLPRKRVDLTVVRDHAVRVCAFPRRKGVGRKARMDHRQTADRTRVRQVTVEGGKLRGQHQPLVDDGSRRAGRDVEGCHAAGARARAIANRVEHALEAVPGTRATDEQLAERWARATGDRPECAHVHGHVAPRDHALTMMQHRRLEHGLLLSAERRLRREEAHGHRVVARAAGSTTPASPSSARVRAWGSCSRMPAPSPVSGSSPPPPGAGGFERILQALCDEVGATPCGPASPRTRHRTPRARRQGRTVLGARDTA